jgi:hypothetical protein
MNRRNLGMTPAPHVGSALQRRWVTSSLALIALLTALLTTAASPVAAGGRTLDQALAASWNCEPLILLGGHYHCSPPGRPGVGDIIAGTDVATIEHQVFRPDGTFAGTELLIRADLFAGQPCPTDEWLPVPPIGVAQYWACHRFDF